MKVAFAGLGVMGYPMAGHLAKGGHDVTVFNRNPAKAEAWVKEYGGKAAATPAAAAEGADFVFCCVGNDDDVREVIAGPNGVLSGMAAGGVLVDHTTASADVARDMAELAAEKGVKFLDAPVSGGQAGAVNGVLTIMIGGEEEAFEQARPIMEAYGRMMALMGPSGSGQLTKMMNQMCIAGVVQGLAEALDFGQRAGIDGERAIEVISKGAAQSWQMENRYQTMLKGEFDFGFAVDWMRKDIAICVAEASRNGAQLPMTRMVDGFYEQIQQRGGGRWDTSSLIDLLQRPRD
jgi:3-hydroxyisobutyrate dehydrogenase